MFNFISFEVMTEKKNIVEVVAINIMGLTKVLIVKNNNPVERLSNRFKFKELSKKNK